MSTMVRSDDQMLEFCDSHVRLLTANFRVVTRREPATVEITDKEGQVRFHRRAHLPIVLASGLLNTPVAVPWWNGLRLRLTV